jgi:Right handed beta helix region
MPLAHARRCRLPLTSVRSRPRPRLALDPSSDSPRSVRAQTFRTFCVSLASACALLPLGSLAATLTVPGSSPTIQGAINLAVAGDVILVSPGIYVESIDFNGKNLTLRSVSGPAVTTITTVASAPVVQFHSGEGLAATLDGFTVTGGKPGFVFPYFGNGGGIFIADSSPTVVHTVIQNNVSCSGGGVAIQGNSSPLIQGNVISNNKGDGSQIIGFSCGNIGGGIYINVATGQSPRILQNVISNNIAPLVGGIGLFNGASTTISGNTILRNGASVVGVTSCGGIPVSGAISMVNGRDVNVVQNVIAYNVGDCTGGVAASVPFGDRGPYLTNNTIALNDGRYSSGLYTSGFHASSLYVNNVIVAKAGQVAAYCANDYSSIAPTFDNNDVFTTSAAAFGGACGVVTGTNGNISIDPVFVAPGADDFRLVAGSPAIDVGLNSAAFLPALDIDGNPRIQPGIVGRPAIVDMGAYERSPISSTPTSVPGLSLWSLCMLSIGILFAHGVIAKRSRSQIRGRRSV